MDKLSKLTRTQGGAGGGGGLAKGPSSPSKAQKAATDIVLGGNIKRVDMSKKKEQGL